jgi:diguanylate cyclase (GGDEF)-like protein
MTPAPTADRKAQIERYLRSLPRGLAFAGELERDFQEDRVERRRSGFEGDALGGVLFVHVLAVVILSARLLAPREAVSAYLTIQLVLTVPSLALVLITRRFPHLLHRVDALSVVVSLLALSAAISINRALDGAIAVYHLFGMSLYPIKLNLRPDFPFKISATFALVYLPVLTVNAFCHPGFDPVASSCASILYVAVTGLGLSANYRMEASSRRIYLNYARETLRNAEIVDANRNLDALARTDALTGLPNRRDFDARFLAEAERVRAQGEPLTLIVLDIDHFKLYNDSLGHPQGDKCIRVVARAILESIGPAPNFAGRIGGEEFAAVLPGASVETAAATAQRIRETVAAMQLPHPGLGERRVVSVSIGVACLNPARPETREALMARADAALYRAKRAGRDRAEVDLRLISA